MKWGNPYPISVVAGTEYFLREREIQRGLLAGSRKFKIQKATNDGEVVDSMTMVATFGEPTLVLVDSGNVEVETLQGHHLSPSPNFKILVRHAKALDTFPFAKELHAAHSIEYNTPTTRRKCVDLAVRFCMAESKKLSSEPMPKKLAAALVHAAGHDLGTLNFEMSKAMAYARFMNHPTLNAQTLRLTLRPTSDLNLVGLKEALVYRNQKKILQSLGKMRDSQAESPVMILLRAKAGPVSLALEWVEVGTLLKKGVSVGEIALRTNIPEWKLTKEVIPASKRWGVQNLKELIQDLGRIEMQVFTGGPSPWTACVSAIMTRAS